ncbi:hypothetical protein [Hyphomicrobium nitrativorans]|uniref:hypothetical protein n=1 Tax=Hyphomicrobium nitrativorans TaxID=1427356 RepID=UPI000ACDE466|nr:hypothetical protein [Hyphomicrobium nitrativorans]
MLNDRLSFAVAARMSRRLSLLALSLIMGAAVSACSDEASDARNKAQTTTEAPAPHQVKWLDLGHQITPAQWLVSRREASLRPVDDADVQRVAARLDAAHGVYRESERMIANRSAQLSDMLAPLGIEESAISLLDDLTGIANDAGMTEGFGAVTQHYFNLRSAKLTREDALADLKARYSGKRS